MDAEQKAGEQLDRTAEKQGVNKCPPKKLHSAPKQRVCMVDLERQVKNTRSLVAWSPEQEQELRRSLRLVVAVPLNIPGVQDIVRLTPLQKPKICREVVQHPLLTPGRGRKRNPVLMAQEVGGKRSRDVGGRLLAMCW